MIAKDVTERRALEGQLRHAQKMDAVGRLAGGVAHDFNNLLTVILGVAEMALGSMSGDHPLRESFGQIKRAGQRANALTRQLLAFSRRQLVEPTVFNLNELLDDSEKMLRRLIEEDIQLTTRKCIVGNIEADPGGWSKCS